MMYSQMKKDPWHMMNLDCNSNLDPHTNFGYTQLRTVTVPNVAISTLNTAAGEFNLPPVSHRRLGVMQSHPKSPQSVLRAPSPSYEKVPRVPMLSPTHSVTLADQRRKKIRMPNFGGEQNWSPESSKHVAVKPNPLKSSHLVAPAPSSSCQKIPVNTLSPTQSLSLAYQRREKINVGAQQKIKQPPSTDWLSSSILDAEICDMKGPPRCLLPKPEPDVCYCYRPKRTVWCIMCGFHVKGNVKINCLQHPQMSFLYQWDRCGNPKCKAPNLLTEIDLLD